MCLRDQGIDDNDGVVARVRRSCGLNDYSGGVGKGRGIDDASEGFETMTEALRIQGRRQSLWRCDGGPLLSSIPWAARKHTGASAVGDVHSDALYLLIHQLMPLLSSLRPRDSRKHTDASAVGDVHSDTLYLLLPQLTPPLSSLRPRAHLTLPRHPSWSPIPKECHHNTAASVVAPESPITRTHCLFLVLHQRLRRRR